MEVPKGHEALCVYFCWCESDQAKVIIQMIDIQAIEGIKSIEKMYGVECV